MVLGAIARGVVGRAGRGSKMAGRMFKRKETPASQQIVDVQATPVNVKPRTPLIPPSPTIDANTISKATPSIGTETLEGTAYRIKTSLVDVDTLLKGSIALDKIRETERRRGLEKKKDEDKERKLESAAKKNGSKFGLGKLVPTKAKSIFGNIINFFVTLLLGKILMGLLDNVGLFKNLALGLAAVANFVLDWGGKLLNAFVSLIGLGYGIYDGLRGTVGNLFGESGMKMFDKFSGVFTLLLNTALIAAMTAGRSGMLGGGGTGPGGLTRVGGARGVKPSAVTRYTQRFGRNAAVKKFGSKAVERYGGTAARSTVTKLGRKGLTSILGKAGSKTFLKTVKRFVSPTVRGIPIIGTLIDFALNLLVFKEPVGKAAFKAIGAGLAAWLGGIVGSVVPVGGTLVGAALGGWAGDKLAGALYDAIFKKKEPKEGDKEEDKKKPEMKELTGEDKRRALAKLEYHKERNQLRRSYGRNSDEVKALEKEYMESMSNTYPSSITGNTNTTKYEGLDKQASYEEEGTTTYVVSQKGSSSGGEETSSGTNEKVTKMSEGLILSNSGSESNNSYDVLAKR